MQPHDDVLKERDHHLRADPFEAVHAAKEPDRGGLRVGGAQADGVDGKTVARRHRHLAHHPRLQMGRTLPDDLLQRHQFGQSAVGHGEWMGGVHTGCSKGALRRAAP
ncbi:hypothetical protein D9M68_878620 [compost metagenome]